MDIILYTTGCPKCHVLEKKLADKNINYKKCSDVDEMLQKGMMAAPNIEVDGKIMDFNKAVEWIKEQ